MTQENTLVPLTAAERIRSFVANGKAKICRSPTALFPVGTRVSLRPPDPGTTGVLALVEYPNPNGVMRTSISDDDASLWDFEALPTVSFTYGEVAQWRALIGRRVRIIKAPEEALLGLEVALEAPSLLGPESMRPAVRFQTTHRERPRTYAVMASEAHEWEFEAVSDPIVQESDALRALIGKKVCVLSVPPGSDPITQQALGLLFVAAAPTVHGVDCEVGGLRVCAGEGWRFALAPETAQPPPLGYSRDGWVKYLQRFIGKTAQVSCAPPHAMNGVRGRLVAVQTSQAGNVARVESLPGSPSFGWEITEDEAYQWEFDGAMDEHATAPPRAYDEDSHAAFVADVDAAVKEIRDLLVQKNQAYGNSALDPVRIFSKADPMEQLFVRIDDKLSRLMRGHAAGEDVVKDLQGYLLLVRVAQLRAARESK